MGRVMGEAREEGGSGDRFGAAGLSGVVGGVDVVLLLQCGARAPGPTKGV